MTAADKNAPVMIEARGICTTLGDKQVLNGISFSLREGETAALLGRSGSGKTTLLRAINMLTPPNAGVMRVCGEDVDCARPDDVQLRRLRRRVVMVFQHFNLWQHLTVLENTTEAPVHALGIGKSEARQRAQKALSQVGMSSFAGRYPSMLSGGQKQRVGIARALAMHPQVILFDEPTSALDPEMVGEVLAVIRDLAARKTTMIIVTHEMAFARQAADRAVFLDDGKIIADGKPAQVFADPRIAAFASMAQRGA
ncbi:MAG: amino acid ABC transporter ATP-binding protein [Gammaproteobacteria bacterium]